MAISGSESRIQGDVNAGGVRTYYEIEGTGEPLLLLHGGFCRSRRLAGCAPSLHRTSASISPSAGHTAGLQMFPGRSPTT